MPARDIIVPQGAVQHYTSFKLHTADHQVATRLYFEPNQLVKTRVLLHLRTIRTLTRRLPHLHPPIDQM